MFQGFQHILLQWFNVHRRDLPWRRDQDPYRIWLSEVILQQTRVDQGTAYFERFTEAFPTVHDLAAAPEDLVLRLWQGLGYYNRARNLHRAAKQIVDAFDGQFPNNYDQLIQLKGVGPYTAAAIASIAFGQPIAVLDGNVMRVITRLQGIDAPIDDRAVLRTLETTAQAWLNTHNPGDHNQAMMEFGATVCTPKQPQCGTCMFASSCRAHAQGIVDRIPWKQRKTKRRSRYLHFLVAARGHTTMIEKRDDHDIWAGLYQFPLKESDEDTEVDWLSWSEELGLKNARLTRCNTLSKHVLSHQDLFARVYHITCDELNHSDYTLATFGELHTFALPRLLDRYLENHDPSTGKKRRD
jgi:A/G-specific adenine glycosylase